MTLDVTQLEGSIEVNLPEKEMPVRADITSSVYDGLTIHIPQSADTWALHQMIAQGNLLALSFRYTPIEKAAQ